MRRLAIVGLSIAGVGLAPLAAPPVHAETATTRIVVASDPAGDVDSRLDIVSAKFRGNGDGTVTLTIATAESWRCGYLREPISQPQGASSSALFWDFDEGANGTYDMSGHFRCEQGRIRFELRRGSSTPARVFRASKPTPSSARVTIPFSALQASRVNMRAMSRVTGFIGGGVFVDEEDLAPTMLAY